MTALVVPVSKVQARETDPDVALVRAMAGGDRAALAAIYERHGARILTYLVGRLSDPALSEEVLQDVMLAAWRGSAAFRADSKVLTWLLSIAHNRAVNATRRKRVGESELDVRAIADRPGGRRVDRVAEHLDLHTALRQLPEDQRAALELVFFHGLTVDETAAVLCTASGTIKSRLHRAKAALRRQLDAEVNTDG